MTQQEYDRRLADIHQLHDIIKGNREVRDVRMIEYNLKIMRHLAASFMKDAKKAGLMT